MLVCMLILFESLGNWYLVLVTVSLRFSSCMLLIFLVWICMDLRVLRTSGYWDLICFIEHLCVSNLLKLLIICGLSYTRNCFLIFYIQIIIIFMLVIYIYICARVCVYSFFFGKNSSWSVKNVGNACFLSWNH